MLLWVMVSCKSWLLIDLMHIVQNIMLARHITLLVFSVNFYRTNLEEDGVKVD